MKNIVPKKKGK